MSTSGHERGGGRADVPAGGEGGRTDLTDTTGTGPPGPDGSFETVMKMRIVLAIGLVIPLAFFFYLVLRFEEAWLLAGIGLVVYLYILAQFFIFQNPRRNARRGLEEKEQGP